MTTRATRGPRRRTVAALLVILIVLAAFVFRLVDIQVVRASEHVADSLSLGQLGSTQSISGADGDIVDADGTVLASSVLVYDAQLDPYLIKKIEDDPDQEPDRPWAQASEQIAAVTGQKADDLRDLVTGALEADPSSRYVKLTNGLSTQEYLELRELGLSYLAMFPRSVRVYPNGAVAGNMIGFLDGEGVGQYGIERTEAACLAPVDGERSFLRGKSGNIIPGSERITPAVDGGTVTLTINSDLNWYLQQMIAEEVKKQGAQAGSVTVVEVATGKIRAAAEYPSLDPNDINSVDPQYWTSQIFTQTYEPGSTFKALTAATVIDAGAATPLTTVSAASREVFPNGAVINDPFPHGVTQYTLAGALIDSSNVSLSKFGTMVSAQVRYEYLKKFGVGKVTGAEFYAEEPGGVRAPESWDNQTLYTTTFGQAFTVTTAQVAAAYQAIANDGKKVELSLVESCTAADGTVTEADQPATDQVVSADTAEQVQEMLENVAVQGVLAERTAVDGYRVGLKTGSAQKPDGKGGYKQGVYFTSIVGVAPIDDPKYVVMVTLDEPTKLRSSAANADAFRMAMTQVLKTYRVPPASEPLEDLLPKTK